MMNISKTFLPVPGGLPIPFAKETVAASGPAQKLALLKNSLKKAAALHDRRNEILITESLAESYIDDLPDREQALLWIGKFRTLARGTRFEKDADALLRRLGPGG
jgi:hypothetical protein